MKELAFFCLGCVSGGEVQSKHKEGFDPLNGLPSHNAVRYGAGPRFATVSLGAGVTTSFRRSRTCMSVYPLVYQQRWAFRASARRNTSQSGR